MESPVLQTVPLGSQWPTLDPFLFCAHHLDRYPKGNGELGPSASLQGRRAGHDFESIDGWNMYHGSEVPGFPHHPHRGFETVTYVRSGYCDHSDSLGAQARFGEGDMQWITAGRGIVHSEMFPLLDVEKPNPLHLFQIWLNLPSWAKMVDPYFSMYWKDSLPTTTERDFRERSTSVTVIAGSRPGATPRSSPPPDSWAADPNNDVQIWHIKMEAGAAWELPSGPSTSNRVLYFFEGQRLEIDTVSIDSNHAAVLKVTEPTTLIASETGAECFLLQGRPIGESVARHGPFVMNTGAENQQAIDDYKATQFGGWPWQSSDPTHGPEVKRFAYQPDGTKDHPG